ncbi:hypothetical protein NKG05_20640 [Oerskovia sp. M15]
MIVPEAVARTTGCPRATRSTWPRRRCPRTRTLRVRRSRSMSSSPHGRSRTPGDPETLDGVATDALVTSAWIGLADVDDASTVVPELQDALADGDVSVEVVGAAVERAMYQSVVDTILGVIVGLLAVAVVIALIGWRTPSRCRSSSAAASPPRCGPSVSAGPSCAGCSRSRAR